MKEEIIKLLKSTNREGIDKVIEFMEKSDFFTAPASTRFHGAYEGGLAAHSFKVYEILKYKIKNNIEDIQVPEESIIISALLHDICKANYYKTDYRNAKNSFG